MKHAAADQFGIDETARRLARLERQLERERRARHEAEAIAERGLRALYESQQRLALVQRVTEAANRAEGLAEALDFAVREVCTQMEWDFANSYLVDEATGGLVATGCWYAAQPDPLFALVEASQAARFSPGEDLPGAVLATGNAQWLTSEAALQGLGRAGAAARGRMASACAVPILTGNAVAGVIEFFARKAMADAETLDATLAQIATQLARVIERDAARRALLHDALHDSLTGLGNRVFLAERGRAAMAQLPADGCGLGLLVIDLDGFKAVNDRHGHHAGDALLAEVARRLRDSLVVVRERALSDKGAAPWRDASIARVGGDEFVALVEGFADIAVLEGLAAQIHAMLARPIPVGTDAAVVGASIGIACSSAQGREVDQIMRDADLAMYSAKAAGRGKTMLFTEQLGDTVRSRALLERELREAIDQRQFELHYQPIMDLADGGQIHGFEALVRWRHPRRGLLMPADFVPQAEESGLIIFIGDWVLDAACRAMAALHARLPAGPHPFISINIAPQQFLQPNFAARVRDVVMGTGIDPAMVKLEVTEGVAITDPERTGRVLAEIRDWGIHTSLDDFGTGYSSLAYLQKLPFDCLKIDRSFVAAMDDAQSRSIIGTIFSLAAIMDMAVVAEGIESDDQRRALEAMGCRLGQGYLYGRPLAQDEAFALLPGEASFQASNTPNPLL